MEVPLSQWVGTRVARVLVAGEAMRARFEIVLVDEGRDEAWLRAAGEEALEEIARVEQELSPFRAEAGLRRINAEAGARPVLVDAVMLGFLERAQRLSHALEGAFDPTVGAMLEPLRQGESLTPVRTAALQRLVGFDRHVRLDPDAGTVAFSAPGVRLDPGAIGKGYALERAAEVLRETGVRRALIHGGTSSVYGLGAPPETPDGWTVAIQDPRDPQRHLAKVVLCDRALGVSASHGRTFGQGEKKRGHVIDPRSGASVHHTALAAAVTASPTDADAISTAVLVLGAALTERILARFPDVSLLCVPNADEGTPAIETSIETWGDAFGAA